MTLTGKAFNGADSGSRCSARYSALDNFRERTGLGTMVNIAKKISYCFASSLKDFWYIFFLQRIVS